ncbi:MAG: thiol-disulfide oxidoreductase DCC family protein [Bdellovibrionales bacterium]
MKSPRRTTVFYDGLCHLCSREINHYRRMKGSDHLDFVDITLADFQANVWGLEPHKVHQHLHVVDSQGRLHTGVAAFIAIWTELPGLRWLVPLASSKPLRWVLDVGYSIFAKIRPLLPRKSCEASPYCPTKGTTG